MKSSLTPKREVK